MYVWLFMLAAIVVLWFAIPEGLGEKKKKLIFLLVCGVMIVFLMGGRCPFRTCSRDGYFYYSLYLQSAQQSWDHLIENNGFEMGYIYLNRFLEFFFPSGQAIIYFEAIFTTGVVFWFIYRNTEDVFIAVVSYITVGSWSFFLSGFKQAFAICFCLISVEWMKKKKFVSDLIALLFIVAACSCHVTAWVFLAVYVLRNIKVNKNTVMLIIIIIIVSLFSIDYVVGLFENFVDSEYTKGYEGNLLGGIVPITTFVIALFLSYIAWTQDKGYIEKNNLLVLMLLVGLGLYLFRYNTMVFERISYYFTAVLCVVLPNSLNAIKDVRTKTISKAFCIVLCSVLFIYRMTDAKDYYFYWQ